MTSLSANTVQVLEIAAGAAALAASASRSSTSRRRIEAITSRNRPVPAAHLSFMTKFTILPEGDRAMTLASCPPMSMTVRRSGNTKRPPRAWAVSSLISPSAPW